MSMVHMNDFVDLSELHRQHPGKYRFKSAPWSDKPFLDEHPDIPAHLKIAETVASNIGTEISELLRNKCEKFHKKIMKGMDFADVEKMYNSHFPYRHITTGC
jgi:hypothetical protein